MDLIVFLVIVLALAALETYIYHRFSLDNVTYSCKFETDEAYEGDEIILVEEISNAKLLPIPWLKAEITTSKWLEFAELQSSVSDRTRFVSSFFMLKSYHKIIRRWKVKCLKRGIFGIEKTVLVATDLFGTVNLSVPVETISNIRILPKPIDIGNILPENRHLYGDRVVRKQLVTDPFYYNGVREYDEGDASKKINWLATAKQNEIMVFNNEYTSDRTVTLIMNIQSRETDRAEITREYMIENCIKFCASVATECAENGVPIRFLSNTHSEDGASVDSGEGYGKEHALAVLRDLAVIGINDAAGFDKFLSDRVSDISSSEIYVVSSYLNDAIEEFARRKRNAVVYVLGGNAVFDEPNIVSISGYFGKEAGK